MNKIKLIKSSFLEESKTKKLLCEFIKKAEIFSMGSECLKFENNFSKKQGRKYSVYVSNGSSANLLLIQSLLNMGKLKKGDKILFSALTWSTNVMPLIQLGLIPVPVDCEVGNLNVGLANIKKTLRRERGIKGLFITNVLGFSSDILEIEEYCKKEKILFLEDNCESLGSEFNGKLLGNFGLASTFSFFIGHHISTIEGGMICTDDKELHQNLLIARAHGWSRNNSSEFKSKLNKEYKIDEFYNKYTFYDLGYNVRPNEITGFLGNTQLGYWDFIVNKRESNFKKFLEASKKNSKIISLKISKNLNRVSNFAFPILFRDKESYLKYKNKFIENGVEIRPILAGDMTLQPFFKKYSKGYNYPNARKLHNLGFYIPNNPELTKKEINKLINLIKNE